MHHNTRPLTLTPIEEPVIPMLAQAKVAECREPGLFLECPLCMKDGGDFHATYLHPVDSRAETRVSIFGSDKRFVVNVLAGCEGGGHIVVLEIANRKGTMNLGFRTPYAGEVISEWHNGTFDNPAPFGGVRFNPDFVITEGDRA